ncbi:peptidoglycan binding domain-containing protein, partial [Candidatus Falkowbacteria bacterium]|nr:peptidoglycan binding domain-containing protein [Candidatus Falkowbacteria bacterium]
MIDDKEEKNNKASSRWLVLTIIFLTIFLIILILAFGFFEYFYAGKFYPGVRIGNMDVSGQTRGEALASLSAIEEKLQEEGLIFRSSEKEVAVNPIVISSSPDLAKRVLTLSWEKTVDEAFAVGRSGNIFADLGTQMASLIFGRSVNVFYELDRDEMFDHLKTSFSGEEKIPVNAALKIMGRDFEVTGEQSGYIYDYQMAIDELIKNINNLDFQPIFLDLVFSEPEIKKQDTGSAVNSLENILAVDSIKLIVDSYGWNLKRDDFFLWLEFQRLDDAVAIGLNKEKVLEFLEPIAKEIN